MILPDVNILVYAYNQAAEHHAVAKRWLEDVVNRDETVFIPWVVSLAFLRLMTHRSVLTDPMESSSCLEIVLGWYQFDNVKQIELGLAGMEHFRSFTRTAKPVGNLFYDAYLAALAREYSATIYTNDADFFRFKDVKVVNPL